MSHQRSKIPLRSISTPTLQEMAGRASSRAANVPAHYFATPAGRARHSAVDHRLRAAERCESGNPGDTIIKAIRLRNAAPSPRGGGKAGMRAGYRPA